MSIQSNINSIIGSVGTAAYLIRDLKFKKDVSSTTKDIRSNMPKYNELIENTDSQAMYFKPEGTPDTWKKGKAPAGSGALVFGKVLSAETQAAIKSLKRRLMLIRDINTGNWEVMR